jgi:hypothetical protein
MATGTGRSAARNTAARVSPADQRGGASARTATIPAQRGAPSVERAGVASRAYARREDRLRRIGGGRAPRAATTAGRAKFVLLVMALLAIGLVLTLWLSTAAAADSYRLQDARVAARTLSEQSEQLRREVTAMDAAPALAQRAAQLGMVPVQDSARLVVAPDGAVTVSGTPKAAIATAPPAPPPAPVAPNGAAPTASTTASATPTAAPNGTDPNALTADAAAAAGIGPDAPVTTTTAATPTPAPTGQASRNGAGATATARASATTSPRSTSTSTPAPSRTAGAVASGANAAGTGARSATATPSPSARPSGPGGGVSR